MASELPAHFSPSTTGETSDVLFHIDDGVACITLNRPERLNAMTATMDASIRTYVRRADADPACVAICITGAGKGFCSGADLGASQAAVAPPYAVEPKTLDEFRFGYLAAVRKPVIAALNGVAIGVGLVLAAFCDVRIVASNAKLGFTYSRVGLVAEYGIAWWLPRMIGLGASRELLLSGRLVEADEALRLGLVDRVMEASSFDADLREYLRTFVERCAPFAMATIKAQLNEAVACSLLDAISSSAHALRTARESTDFAEGRAAFSEKRLPNFGRLNSGTGEHR